MPGAWEQSEVPCENLDVSLLSVVEKSVATQYSMCCSPTSPT